MSDRVAAYLLTGFLGSGKTTLLRGVLEDPAFHDTAVIVNEFGKVSLDHDLISFSAESTVVMPGGCVCCTIREDIEASLRQLFEMRDQGRIPAFKRLVIETTGIAEPVPILMTLKANPLAQERLIEPVVITVVDGVLGVESLSRFPEAAAQVTSADVTVISKTDLADAAGVTEVEEVVRALNPWAAVRHVNLNETRLSDLFSGDLPSEPRAMTETSGRETSELYARRPKFVGGAAQRHSEIVSHAVVMDKPLDWTAFGVWMTMLLHRHGARVLRVKGLLAVDGLPGPTLFQSAQHLVHVPVHMDVWPSDDRTSRIVFIVRGIDPELLQASLTAFEHAARNAVSKRTDQRSAGSGGVIAGRPVKRPTTPAWIRG